jgi:hypothetical protein
MTVNLHQEVAMSARSAVEMSSYTMITLPYATITCHGLCRGELLAFLYSCHYFMMND